MSIALATGALLGGTIAAAGLMAPSINRRIAGDIRRDWLAQETDFDKIHADGATVLLKSGKFAQVIRIDGAGYDAMPSDEGASLSEARAEAFSILASANINVRLFAIKRMGTWAGDSEWPEGAPREIGAKEALHFREAFELSWYVLIDGESYQRLVEASGRFISLLTEHRAQMLRQGHTDCELTGFLAYLLTGHFTTEVATQSQNMAVRIGGSDLTITKTGDIWTNHPSRQLQRIIAVRRWPELISGHLIGELLRLPLEIEISQVAIPESKARVQIAFDRKAAESRRLTIFGGAVRAEQFEEAVAVLGSEGTSIFQTEMSIILRKSNEAEMEEASPPASKPSVPEYTGSAECRSLAIAVHGCCARCA